MPKIMSSIGCERVITLTELRQYLDQGLDLPAVIKQVETTHGVVKIFDHSPQLMAGLKFRYFVVPLTRDGQPATEIAKGANLQ